LPPTNWRDWLLTIFPDYFKNNFAPHHVEYWEWVWAIERGVMPDPFVGIWARGGGKSTGAEGGCVSLGCNKLRHYCWYIRSTQDQSDKSVENVASMLESKEIEEYYPLMSEGAVNKYGQRRGWRRQRLITKQGFTVDALGLDTAARGIKKEEHRPDLIIFDDVDDKHDTEKTTQKKIEAMTHKIIPAGSHDVAVIAIQNLIIPDGVFSRLADGRAEFLKRRKVSGPHPAAHNLTYEQVEVDGRLEYKVTGGEPTWEGQNLDVIEDQINLMGIRAFLEEAQHEVAIPEGALWSREEIDKHRVNEYPGLIRIGVGVDPHASVGETGIIVAGIHGRGGVIHAYILEDATIGGKPNVWGSAVVAAYNKFKADIIIGEVNNGGDMVENTIRNVSGGLNVNYTDVRATRGKILRAEPIQNLYDEGRVHHVGHYQVLENQMCKYVPGDPSPNNMDALVWVLTKLVLEYDGSDKKLRIKEYA
jgi:hypothetical protein